MKYRHVVTPKQVNNRIRWYGDKEDFEHESSRKMSKRDIRIKVGTTG
jgi:hypothetical protein